MINKIIKHLYNIAHAGRKWYWRTFKIKTFGARVLVEKEGKVFLVRHRYGDLWVFPGGGLKKGEDPKEVARREAREEVDMVINSFKGQLGIYKNRQSGKDDTLSIFIADDFTEGTFKPNFEIKETGWFDINNLPEHTSEATVRRVEEYKNWRVGDAILEKGW